MVSLYIPVRDLAQLVFFRYGICHNAIITGKDSDGKRRVHTGVLCLLRVQGLVSHVLLLVLSTELLVGTSIICRAIDIPIVPDRRNPRNIPCVRGRETETHFTVMKNFAAATTNEKFGYTDIQIWFPMGGCIWLKSTTDSIYQRMYVYFSCTRRRALTLAKRRQILFLANTSPLLYRS